MKNLFRILLPFLIAGSFLSCEKKVETINYEGGTAPVLSADRATVVMSFATQLQEALKLMWTNPDYRFTTGISSHDVSYLLEIGLEGTNFSPVKAISLSRDMSVTFTEGELNDYLLNVLGLAHSVSHPIQFRVTSRLLNNAVPLTSNTLKFNITPFQIPPKVTPPASNKLFIVGSATPGGWNNPVPVPSQEFTQVNPTFYTLDVNLIGGMSYLLLPVNGDWSAKFGAIGANNTNNPNEDDFKAQGGDLLSPTASGLYRIEVDFQRGRFKLTKL